MPTHDLISVFIDKFNKLQANYFVTGAVAGIIYGEPRLTHDLDLVIEIDRRDVDRFVAAFPLDAFYCPPAEIINVEIGRDYRGHFNLIHHGTGFKADVYLSGKDELHKWAMANRQSSEYEENVLWLAPIEYVILRKLEYYREGGSGKHLRDIRSMLDISADRIDSAFLESKIQEFDLEREWLEAKPQSL